MNEEVGYSNLSVDQQLRYYWTQLPTAHGLGALAVLGFLVFLLLRFDRAKWWVLTLTLFMATLGFSTNPWMDNRLAPPLEQIRSLFRPITLALIAMLLIPTLRATRGARQRVLRPAVFAFFFLELVTSVRLFLGAEFTRGTLGAVVFLGLFVIFGFGVSLWLQDLESVWSALRSLVCAASLMVLSTAYQLAIDRSHIIAQSRLYGTTNNPQTLGAVLALTIPVACYLFARRGEPKAWRLFYALFIGLGSVFLIWTGSRLGVLMIGLELLLLYRIRLGRLVPVALAGGVVAYIALSLMQGPLEAVTHLMSTENSRITPWTNLWNTFLAEPVLGTGNLGTGLGENSYLSVAAAFGVLGLIPLGILLVFIFKDLWRLMRIRRSLGEHGLLADLMAAMMVTFLFSFVFEAYLIGTVTLFVFCLYMVFDVTAFLLDPAWAAGPQPIEYAAEGLAGAGEWPAEWSLDGAGVVGPVDGMGAGELAGGRYDPQYVPDYSPN